jgi:hypothetical protein
MRDVNNTSSRILHILICPLLVVCWLCQSLAVSGSRRSPHGLDLLRKDGLYPSADLAGCSLFPADNIWNARVDSLPLAARSSDWINSIGRSTGFHMDFGSGTWNGGPIGIPYNIVDESVAKVPVDFYYPDESDPGPYPIPASPLIEYGSDHHLLILDSSSCRLYEIFDASYSAGAWHGGSGAIWDLGSDDLRPAGWTSADAAGLPILPGLVRYDEIIAGAINHALRFTASQTNGYIWPARHLTSNDPSAPHVPPLGARFRLKASYDISGFPAELQVILQAMKTYGISLADNGSNWYVSGVPDERWDNDMLRQLNVLTGDDFEAVDTSVLMVDPNSGQVCQVPTITTTAVTKISPSSAQSGGNITTDGGSAVTARGVCWSRAANPTTSGSHTSDGTGPGAYVSSLSGLSPKTTYHARAYATNSIGTAYGNDVEFTTLPAGAWTISHRLTWTSGQSSNPAVAVDPSSNIHLVWSDSTPGNTEIYYRKSPDGGANWAAAKRLTSTLGASSHPAIFADASGCLHLVWSDETPGNGEIYYKKSTDGGTTWSANKRLTWTSGQSFEPTMAADLSGNLHVIWEDSTPGNGEIYYVRSTDGGATWAASKRLTWNSGLSYEPALAVDPSGDVQAAWVDGSPGNWEIYHKKSTDRGATWGDSRRLIWTSGGSYAPAAALFAPAHLLVFWSDNTPGNYEIYCIKSMDGGATWAKSQRLTWTSGDSWWPAAALETSADWHLVWYDNTPGNDEIYYRRSKDGGATWSAIIRLTTNTGLSEYPDIAVDLSGSLHVVWSDSTPGNYEIYYRKFTE